MLPFGRLYSVAKMTAHYGTVPFRYYVPWQIRPMAVTFGRPGALRIAWRVGAEDQKVTLIPSRILLNDAVKNSW